MTDSHELVGAGDFLHVLYVGYCAKSAKIKINEFRKFTLFSSKLSLLLLTNNYMCFWREVFP